MFARNLRVIRDKNFVKNKKKIQWDREDSGLGFGISGWPQGEYVIIDSINCILWRVLTCGSVSLSTFIHLVISD